MKNRYYANGKAARLVKHALGFYQVWFHLSGDSSEALKTFETRREAVFFAKEWIAQ